jgi:hypothetical protein
VIAAAAPRRRWVRWLGITPRALECRTGAHLGPLLPAGPQFDGWLGLEWAECAACGSHVSTTSTPTPVAS